jgi:cyanophycin synthetase
VKAINFKIFEGRSVYSHRRCIRLNLDLERSDNLTIGESDSFKRELLKLLPEIGKHQCSFAEDGGFIRRLEEGTFLHHVCGHIAIALQNMIGLDVSYCSESGQNSKNYYTVYEFKYKNTGIEAGKAAIDIIKSLLEKKNFHLVSRLAKLQEILKEEQLDSGKNQHSLDKINQNTTIIAITGTNGKTTTTRIIAYVLSKAGVRVGMTTTDGIYINGHCVFKGDTTGPVSARTVLTNNEIDAAVLETARGGMVRDGLAYDLADVAVITNITDDHLGLDGIETLEDLAKVKTLVGEAVKKEGYVVINGDDEMSMRILNRIKRKLIIFSEDKNNPILAEGIENGGYGIYINKGILCIENKSRTIELMPVEDIGITLKGILKYNIQNAMAACGALIGYGIDSSVIREGLKSFKCNEDLNPGRFNMFNLGGILTVLDYGHNVEGYKSVLEGLTVMKHNRLIGIIGVPGDRLDRTTLEVGRIAGNYLDYIFIKEDKDRRERQPMEIANILRKGVLSSGFDDKNIRVVLDEVAALEEALDIAEPGDIVIIFFEEYDPLLQLVRRRINNKVQEVALT